MANCIENISTKEECHVYLLQMWSQKYKKVEDIILNNKVQSDLLRKQIHEVVISGLVKP